jgi:hypothetical protein
MSIVLTYAEKSGTKDITHDLHFQSPKYEVTHVLVRSPRPPKKTNPDLARTICTLRLWARNSQNHLRDFSRSSLNQAKHQATRPPRPQPLQPLPKSLHPKSLHPKSLPPKSLPPKSLPPKSRRPYPLPWQKKPRNENPRPSTTRVRRKRYPRARSGQGDRLIWIVLPRDYKSCKKRIYCRLSGR